MEQSDLSVSQRARSLLNRACGYINLDPIALDLALYDLDAASKLELYPNLQARVLICRVQVYIWKYQIAKPEQYLGWADLNQALMLPNLNACNRAAGLALRGQIYKLGLLGLTPDPGLALTDLTAALAITGADYNSQLIALSHRAEMYRPSQPQLAIADYTRLLALALTPRLRARYLHLRGTLYYEMGGRLNMALADFNAAMTCPSICQSQKAKILLSRGRTLYTMRNRYHAALQDFEALLRITEPTTSLSKFLLFLIGDILYRGGLRFLKIGPWLCRN